MAKNMGEWPSEHGQITKIRLSDGCARDTVPLALERWYDFHGFGSHLGNVGLNIFSGRKVCRGLSSCVMLTGINGYF